MLACICGEPYESHFRKDGSGILKKYDNDKHKPRVTRPFNRKMRRQLGF